MKPLAVETPAQAKSPRLNPLSALLNGLCPRCRQGRIYASIARMNERCPACGLKFEREQGYFLGAMGVSYLVGTPLLSAMIAILSFLVFPEWPAYKAILPALLIFLPVVPLVCQYSRIIWIHFDRWIDPDAVDS